MLLRTLAGTTVRLTLKSLTHLDRGAVTSGATVTFAMTDPAGNAVAGSAVANDGSDWHADFTPTAPGRHAVRATATVGSAVFEGKDEVWVEAF